jgi:hypothetical protein
MDLFSLTKADRLGLQLLQGTEKRKGRKEEMEEKKNLLFFNKKQCVFWLISVEFPANFSAEFPADFPAEFPADFPALSGGVSGRKFVQKNSIKFSMKIQDKNSVRKLKIPG